MISEKALRLAVDRAVLTSDQANALIAIGHETAAAEFEPAEDREKLRFIAGFGDIFVVIGIALFLGAAGYFLFDLGGLTAFWIGLTLLSLALSELFTRRRRMAFPSIVLLLIFAISSFFSVNVLITAFSSALTGNPNKDFGLRLESPASIGLAALAAAVLIALHYRRYHVPITIAAGAAGLALALFALLGALAPDTVSRFAGWVILLLGIAVFTLAMRFDQSDLRRETRRTDIAFWLHLLAAPMIVHSFMQIAFGGLGEVTLGKAIGLIIVFALLSVLALLIDRRAILVSALIYAGVAFGTLFKQTALVSATIPASLLVLGAFILGLSSGWQPLRRAAMAALPPSLRSRLPTTTSASKP